MKKRKIRDFVKSLKFRLVLICMIVGIVSGYVIRVGILQSYEKRAVSVRNIDILSQAKILANQIVDADYVHDTSLETITAQLEQLSKIYDGRVMIIDSSFRITRIPMI